MKKILSKWLMGEVVHKETVDAPFEEVMDKLKQSVADHGFGIQAIHDLKQTYMKKHLALSPDFEYRIVEICEPAKSYKALTDMSYDMGVMMPKSIIVAREDGKTTLRYMKLKPWMVAMMFPELDVAPLSAKVSGTMDKIIQGTRALIEQNKQGVETGNPEV